MKNESIPPKQAVVVRELQPERPRELLSLVRAVSLTEDSGPVRSLPAEPRDVDHSVDLEVGVDVEKEVTMRQSVRG